MENYSVYKLTFPDNKIYIGISINPKKDGLEDTDTKTIK